MTRARFALLAAVTLVIAGCYTVPPRPAALDEARRAIDAAVADPQVARFAPGELRDAIDTYERAEYIRRSGGDPNEVLQQGHLAAQRAVIAQDLARVRYAQRTNRLAEADRLAERQAEQEEATRAALLEEARADSARRAADQAQSSLARQQARGASPPVSSSPLPPPPLSPPPRVPPQPAASSQSQRSAAERYAVLRSELRDLAAAKTERGMVVTLNDVLFDPAHATLRPGGHRLVARLAEFLREYPEGTIAVEGFADGASSDAQGQDLSERRAEAVRLALVDAGVDGSRVLVHGYGKAFPVASNDTAEGQKRNRRVEVVISDERGEIGPRVATYSGR